MKQHKTGVSKITYQTGVDVLGFPIYHEHTVITEEKVSKFRTTRKLTVLQRIFKQY